jgi:hypothetical protein
MENKIQSGAKIGRKTLTLLATRQLLNALLLVMLAIKTDTDAHTCIILHGFPRFFIRFLILTKSLIRLALDNQASATCGNETLEDGGKFLGDLLEGSFNSFIFALVKYFHEFLDRGLRVVKFLAAFGERVTLSGKAVVLLKSFLVYMLIFFEGFRDLLEACLDLA